jgi:SpoU rRNA methylase family enzyme
VKLFASHSKLEKTIRIESKIGQEILFYHDHQNGTSALKPETRVRLVEDSDMSAEAKRDLFEEIKRRVKPL